jgi:hypothetical protein
MHVSCLDVPRAQGHIEDIKAKYGEGSNAYRVRVLGEFPTADDETSPVKCISSGPFNLVHGQQFLATRIRTGMNV